MNDGRIKNIMLDLKVQSVLPPTGHHHRSDGRLRPGTSCFYSLTTLLCVCVCDEAELLSCLVCRSIAQRNLWRSWGSSSLQNVTGEFGPDLLQGEWAVVSCLVLLHGLSLWRTSRLLVVIVCNEICSYDTESAPLSSHSQESRNLTP